MFPLDYISEQLKQERGKSSIVHYILSSGAGKATRKLRSDKLSDHLFMRDHCTMVHSFPERYIAQPQYIMAIETYVYSVINTDGILRLLASLTMSSMKC